MSHSLAEELADEKFKALPCSDLALPAPESYENPKPIGLSQSLSGRGCLCACKANVSGDGPCSGAPVFCAEL